MIIYFNKKALVICISLLLFFQPRCFSQTSETADFSSLKILNTGNDGSMTDFSVSRNQRYFAIANDNKTIKLFDGLTGKFLKRINGYHEKLIEIILLPKGDKILSIGFDNTLAIINVADEKVISTFSLPSSGRIKSLDINGDGSEIAAGDNKGNLFFVDINSMKLISKSSFTVPQVTSVRYSRDFKTIAVGTGQYLGPWIKKRPIYLIDSKTREVVKTLNGDMGATTALCFSYDGKFLFSGHKSNSRKIKIWDLENPENPRNFKATINFLSVSGYSDISVDNENKVLLATTDDNSVEIFDIKSGESIASKGRGKVNMLRKLEYLPKIIFNSNEGKNFIVGGFNQNLLYIFNKEKRGVTGYIHSYNDEWAVIAADGRMDGSADAISNLVWQDGGNKIPLEQTFDRAYTPKLLVLLVSEASYQKEFEVSQLANLLPEIQLTSIAGQDVPQNNQGIPKIRSQEKVIKVQVKITSNEDQITELSIHQNAKLVGTKPKENKICTFEVTLTDAFGPDNYFYITAHTKSGIDADKKQFIVEYTGKTSEKPKLYLLTIGINQYKNPKYSLNYAAADANEFEKTMKSGANNLFDEIISIPLRDDKASKENIDIEFQKVKNQAKEQDMFIFYYAGHGVMSEGANAEFHLIPYDVTQLYGSEDMLKQKAITATYLKEMSKGINAQKQVFILDACQSAGALESVVTRGVAEEKAIAQLARSTGTFWITATGSEQFATEFKDLGHGVFTYSLIEGLAGKAANSENRVTIKGLSAYVESRVPDLSEKYKGTPQYPSGYSFGNDFPVVVPNQNKN